jgi:deoxyribodipyrimidine photolyase-related protein
MPRTLRLILGDQLNVNHSWFQTVDPSITYLLMEVRSEATYVTHHTQKIVAFFLAMRSFAETLTKLGHKVRYIKIDDPDNSHSLAENIERILREERAFSAFSYQLPDEYRVDKLLTELSRKLKVPTTIADTEHFLTTRDELSTFFSGKRTRIMESFYRMMRQKHEVLIQDGKPEGGKWNYDAENRKRYDGTVKIPPRPRFTRQADADEIATLIRTLEIPTIGTLAPNSFNWPVTRDESLKALEHFVANLLPHFGRYQDALDTNDPFLFHSLLSFPLNVKLISPREVIDAALAAYRKNKTRISIEQVEGFIRQILGWREYMRGLYWERMPKFVTLNFFDNTRALPEFFWTGHTKMNCLKHAINQSLELAYAHHIQRLMVTGSFAMMAGINPDEVDRWYLGIYIDAVEWVELMNTRGMSQFADGGLVATKPYCGSANYMKKMSNYCSGCSYDPNTRTESDSCPLNALYWDFHIRSREKLESNPRIGMVYRTIDKMDAAEKRAVKKRALFILDNLDRI